MTREQPTIKTRHRALVPLAKGFEEIEAVTIVDVLRRADVEVVVAGIAGGPVVGSRGVTIVPDALLADVADQDFDLVAIPGGAEGARALAADSVLGELVRAHFRDERMIAAICAGPTVLHRLGLLDGRDVACHPSVEGSLAGARVRAEPVVSDGCLITSRGPGTAMDFALSLVGLLEGESRMQAIGEAMLARPPLPRTQGIAPDSSA